MFRPRTIDLVYLTGFLFFSCVSCGPVKFPNENGGNKLGAIVRWVGDGILLVALKAEPSRTEQESRFAIGMQAGQACRERGYNYFHSAGEGPTSKPHPGDLTTYSEIYVCEQSDRKRTLNVDVRRKNPAERSWLDGHEGDYPVVDQVQVPDSSLQPGDVLIELQETKLSPAVMLEPAIRRLAPEISAVKIKIRRQGTEMLVEQKLGWSNKMWGPADLASWEQSAAARDKR